MIVVSDTTAISNLLTVNQADLLINLFGRVLIPSAVWSELSVFHSQLPQWLEVATINDKARVLTYQEVVHAGHAGEAEAIALAYETHSDWLLIDDSDGRRLAKREGLPVLGLMGILLLAKQRGLLPQVRPLLDQLITQAGFYVSQALRIEVLRLACESA